MGQIKLWENSEVGYMEMCSNVWHILGFLGISFQVLSQINITKLFNYNII